MKRLSILAGSLSLFALLLTAHAQTPVTEHDNPNPAKPTAKTTKGKGANNKTIGHKMVQKSKPTDSFLPLPPKKQ